MQLRVVTKLAYQLAVVVWCFEFSDMLCCHSMHFSGS
jgi:hypothetical protein